MIRRVALVSAVAGLFSMGCEGLSISIETDATDAVAPAADQQLARADAGPGADTSSDSGPPVFVDARPTPPDSGPGPEDSQSAAADLGAGNLIYANDFEGGIDNVRFTPCGEVGVLPYPYTFAWSSTIFSSGRYALRVENRGWNDNNVCSSTTDGKHRAEIKHGTPDGLDAKIGKLKDPTWFGFSVYVPRDFPEDNPGAFLMTQFNGGSYGPEFWIAMNKNGREFVVNNLYLKGDVKTKVSYGQPRITVLKGEWMHFILYRKRSPDSDGETKLWVNGDKVVDHQGPNAFDYAAVTGSNGNIRFKHGIYWGDNAYDRTYVLYFDNVKVAKGPNEYASVDPQR